MAPRRTLIVGAGATGRLLERKLATHPEYGLELVGFVDANPTPADGAAPLLGAPAELPRLVEELSVDRVIVAFSLDGHERLLHLVRELIEQGVEVDLVPRLFEMIGPNVKLGALEGVPLLNVPRLRLSRGSRAAKRAFDVALSGGLLLVLLPAFALIAIAIKLDSNGPVFFRQRRIGEDSRPFTMLKFRSMFVGADARKADVAHLNLYARNGDARMFKIEEDPRVTRVGNFLRRHCLDELPQLVNILRGDMSLVGPRPLIPEEDRYVVDWQRRRLAVKPGVTGLWQVLGCNEIPFDEMVKLDYLYVTGWSLLSDAQLLMRTATAVMRRRHSY
jgi:exopolysaccharide biosynthesis polyprenyl glycosylphosphotransferase